MAEEMSVQAVLSAVDANFTATMEKAVNELAKVNDQNQTVRNTVTNSGQSMLKMGVLTGVGMAAVSKAMSVVSSSLGGAISRFDTLNKYPVVMRSLGYSAQDVAKSTKTLSDGIDGLPTTLDGITSIAQQLAPLTGSADKASKSAVALNNAFLASGASTADAERGLQQYTQMLSTGKVDMMSWETLMETMPIALRKVANSFGFTGKSAENDLYKALQSGSITMDQLNDKFIELNNGQDGFANLAKKNSAGIATSFANLKNAVVKNMANMLMAINQGFENAGFGSIASVLDSFKGTINSTFKAITPVVTNVTATILKTLSSMFKFVSDNRDWLGPLTVGIGSFLVSLSVVGKAESIISGISRSFNTFRTISSSLGPIRGVASALGELGSKGGIAGRVVQGLLKFLGLGPWGIAITAIAAVVTALTVFFTTTKTGRQMWQGFMTWFQGIWQTVGPIVSAVWDGITTAVSTVITTIQTAWQGFVTWFQGIWNSISPVVVPVIQAIVGIIATMFTSLQGLWTMLQGLWTMLQPAFSSIGTALSTLAPLFSALWGYIQQLWTLIQPIVQYLISTLGPVLAVVIVGAIMAIITSLTSLSIIVSTIVGAIQVAVATTVAVFSAAFTIISGVIQIFAVIFQTVGQIIVAVFTGNWSAIPGIVKGGWNKVSKIFSNTVGSLNKIVANWGNSLIQAGKSIMDGFLNGLKAGWNAVTKFIGGIKDWIVKHKGPISDDAVALIPAGQAFMQGLNAGLLSGFTDVQDNVMQMSGWINDAINQSIDTINGFKSADNMSVNNDLNRTITSQSITDVRADNRYGNLETLVQTAVNKLDNIDQTPVVTVDTLNTMNQYQNGVNAKNYSMIKGRW